MRPIEDELDIFLEKDNLRNQEKNPSIDALVKEILTLAQPLPPSLPKLPAQEEPKKRCRLFVGGASALFLGLLIGSACLIYFNRPHISFFVYDTDKIPCSEIIEPILPSSEFKQLAPEQKT